MSSLADRHRVVAMDLRGFGWSEAPAHGYEKENLADDVLAVLDELGIERVNAVRDRDVVLRPELLEGYERHADEMTVELVAERARAFFAEG
jgi:hypothetical protein